MDKPRPPDALLVSLVDYLRTEVAMAPAPVAHLIVQKLVLAPTSQGGLFWYSPRNNCATWMMEKSLYGTAVLFEALPKAAQLGLMRARCLYDLFWFTSEILGYNASRPGMGSADLDPEFHGALCEEVVYNNARKRLWLLPRGHLKSTIITMANTIRRIMLTEGNERSLIISDTSSTGCALLGEIKDHFISNDKLKLLWPERMPRLKTRLGDTWNEDAITVPRSIRVKEPVVHVVGLESNSTGFHYDRMAADDVVTRDNSNSPEMREKLLAKMRLLESIIEPGAQEDIVGTRYFESDYYGHILANPDIYSDFVQYVYTAFRGPKELMYDKWWRVGAVEGEPVWPAKYTPERLADIRVKQQEEFSGQYLMDPIPEQTEFPRDALKRAVYADDDLKQENIVDGCIICDLAVSEAESADDSAIGVYAMTHERKIYTLEIRHGRWNPSRMIDEVLACHKQYGYRVAFESVAYQKSFKHFLEKAANEKRLVLHVEEIKRLKTSKEMRIRGLIPWVTSERFKFRQEHGVLRDQMLRFPIGEHDDVLDTAADAPHVLRVRSKRNRTQQPKPAASLFGATGR